MRLTTGVGVVGILAVAVIARLLTKHDFDADSNFDWSQVPPWPVFNAVMAFATWLPFIETLIMPPHIRVAGVASSHIQSRALYAAAHWGIADVLAKGPLSVSELAKAKGVNEERLARVLRLLTTLGIFREISPGVFANNKASGVLRVDHPTSVRDLVGVYGDESYYGFTKFPESLAQDHQGNSFVDITGGMSHWEYIDLPDKKATVGARFDRAMVQVASWNIPTLLQDYDWSQHTNQTVADVGGGLGHILRAVMEHQPSISGILFDRPAEIERAETVWQHEHSDLLQRTQLVAGDFFESVPPADVYFMQHILHDWDDESCLRILKTLREAIVQQGSPSPKWVLLSEIALPEKMPGLAKTALDLQMLSLPGGKERTVAQWAALLEAGGFKLEKVVPMRALDSVIMARSSRAA